MEEKPDSSASKGGGLEFKLKSGINEGKILIENIPL